MDTYDDYGKLTVERKALIELIEFKKQEYENARKKEMDYLEERYRSIALHHQDEAEKRNRNAFLLLCSAMCFLSLIVTIRIGWQALIIGLIISLIVSVITYGIAFTIAQYSWQKTWEQKAHLEQLKNEWTKEKHRKNPFDDIDYWDL